MRLVAYFTITNFEKEDNLEDVERDGNMLNPTQIKCFFTFFCLEMGLKRKPYLSTNDVKELQKIGLRLPKNGKPNKVFTLNTDDKGTIYELFHTLWKYNGDEPKRGTQVRYAQFIKTYFSNFEHTSLSSIRRRISEGNPNFVNSIKENYLLLK